MHKSFSFETQNAIAGVRRQILSHRNARFFPLKKLEFTGLKRRTYIQLKKIIRKRLPYFDFTCELCQNLIIDPIVTSCGHISCRKCLIELLSFRKECPACKEFIGPLDCFKDLTIKDHLARKIKTLEPPALFEYSLRENAHRIWRDKIRIKKLNIGREIDYLDDFGEWRQGSILRVIKMKKTRKYRIFVASVEKSLVDQITCSDAIFRIAPFRFMTEPNLYQLNRSTLPSDRCAAAAVRSLPHTESNITR